MNILHADNEEVKGDRLKAMFERQRELMEKYHEIELKSGLMQTEDCPVNLNDKYGQQRIKDYCWRIVEELGEALDAMKDYPDEDDKHVKEELIDGLHFLIEMTILCGWDYSNICNFEYNGVGKDSLLIFYESCKKKPSICMAVTDFICDIGNMANCLKNKPWKQENMLTDEEKFYLLLYFVWLSYFSILSIFMDDEAICDIYFKKSQVNKFRQRSNY